MLYYNIKNFSMTQLAATLASDATTMSVYNIGNFLEPPAMAILSTGRGLRELSTGEIIEITGYSGNDYEVVRSKTVSHPQGTLVLGNIFAEHFDQIYENQRQISTFMARSFGSEAYGIVRTGRGEQGSTIDFALNAYSSQLGDFRFTISAGYGFTKIEPDPSGIYPYYCIPVEIGFATLGPTGVIEKPVSGSNVYTIYVDSSASINVVAGQKTINDLTRAALIVGVLTVVSTSTSLKDILDLNCEGSFDDQRYYF